MGAASPNSLGLSLLSELKVLGRCCAPPPSPLAPSAPSKPPHCFPHTRRLIPTTTATSDHLRSDMLPSSPPFGRVHRLGMQLRIFDFNFQWKSVENTPWCRLRRRPRSASRPVGGGSLSRFPLKIEISKVARAIFPNSKGGPGGPLGLAMCKTKRPPRGR